MSRNKKKGFDRLQILSYVFFAVALIALALYILLTVGAKKIRVSTDASSNQPVVDVVENMDDSENENEDFMSEDEEADDTDLVVPSDEGGAVEEDTQPSFVDLTIPSDIHTLSADEIAAIYTNFDGNVNEFSVSLDPAEKDQYNRPFAANNLIATINGYSVPVTCYCSDENTPQVAFSFQCEKENGNTEKVLDILKENNIKATFYITHSYASHNSDIVKRMIKEGHEVGNHSYTCPPGGIAHSTLEDLMNDAINMQNYVSLAFGYQMRKFNFNDGAYSVQAVKLIHDMGYEVVFSSSNYHDADPDQSFDKTEVLEGLERNLHNGCIYCLHTTNEITTEVLPDLISFCKEQGFSIVSLP